MTRSSAGMDRKDENTISPIDKIVTLDGCLFSFYLPRLKTCLSSRFLIERHIQIILRPRLRSYAFLRAFYFSFFEIISSSSLWILLATMYPTNLNERRPSLSFSAIAFRIHLCWNMIVIHNTIPYYEALVDFSQLIEA